eukprot:CAMPEP_0172858908 /NCGR_PEP_ID=MMETSP1075-20121228/68299_1 /TAXON_ID=2916 /ORGANISM="Ceratium fusus, Strain PA161109" /LENGTH=118 /DNA_ID=CAMNT_0013706571 /DNA_START=81 /DNA_END=437 /DNA_ORIENTATION=-
MLCKGLGFLLLCLFFNATSASPGQGSQANVFMFEDEGLATLQKRIEKVHTSGFFEEEDEDDDGEPKDFGGDTSGAMFTQAGMTRDHQSAFFEEEEKDCGVSSQQQQQHASWETDGMTM